MGANPFWCCCQQSACDCTLRDTVYGETINTGCCHLDDELLLWCARPGFQTEYWNNCSNGQVHYQTDDPTCDPIVALYKFFGCFYRVAYPPPLQGAEAMCNLPRKCSITGCSGPPPSGTTTCEPGGVDWLAATDPCCATGPGGPGPCECNTTWLSKRRRFVLADGDARYPSPCKWLDELACYAGGADVCGLGSAYNQFLGVVYFERQWKIPDGIFFKHFCPPTHRVHITNCGTNCTDEDSNPTDAVPYWFGYAGAGVPLLRCDLDDALRHGVINGTEYTSLLTDLLSRVQPDQAILCKLRDILSPGDWRDEQVAAWQQLHTRFPSAGYGACPSNPCDLPLLGPFRKRCVPTTCSAGALPCWRRSLMTSTQQLLQPTCGQIAYPGNCRGETGAADFAYWAQRQWSYWRGVPGGWRWGCWDLSPEQFLAGVGSNSLDCTKALRNEKRCNGTGTNMPCQAGVSRCCGYGDTSCGTCFDQACSPFLDAYTCIGAAQFVCDGLAVQPECYGIQFTGFKYYMQNNIASALNPKMRCLYSARSFLTSAKRSSVWNATCPMSCVAASPPLAMFSAWPALEPGVLGERVICNDLDTGPVNYTSADLCCGNHCPSTDASNCTWWEELEGTTSTIRKACAAGTNCPPTLSAEMAACLGYTPTCP